MPLTPDFIEYIKEDGIVLADDDDEEDDDDDIEWECGPTAAGPSRLRQEDDSDDSDSEDEAPERSPPNKRFPALHKAIADKIAECGGAVAPKLNWTSPKDAAWISPHQNTIKCKTPNDIYLLLKSSNFITYDLEHAFDDCTPVAGASKRPPADFKPVLVLRSYFNPHTALEFRCFVKHRNLVAVSPRDLKFYDFLLDLRPAILARIQDFFRTTLRYTFPDGSFVFDVYIPEDTDDEDQPLGRPRLIDINAWAPHTDSLLFGWNELNEWPVPGPVLGTTSAAAAASPPRGPKKQIDDDDEYDDEYDDETTTDEDEDEDEVVVPELRLIEKDDPSAFNFSSPAYSAHKLPKDVVDASLAGQGGMREFALKWKEMVEYRDHLAAQERGGN